MRRLFVPVAGGALAERARHGRVLVAGLIVLLCFVSLSFIDPRTVAQEVVGQDRWHMAIDIFCSRSSRRRRRRQSRVRISRNVQTAAR